MTDEVASETERESIDATLRALCTHGYADLSIASVAEEFDESESLPSEVIAFVDEVPVERADTRRETRGALNREL